MSSSPAYDDPPDLHPLAVWLVAELTSRSEGEEEWTAPDGALAVLEEALLCLAGTNDLRRAAQDVFALAHVLHASSPSLSERIIGTLQSEEMLEALASEPPALVESTAPSVKVDSFRVPRRI